MLYHLRFTPYELSADLSQITDKYPAVVAYETTRKNGTQTEPHYHILIDTMVSRSTLLLFIKKILPIPQGKNGVSNKYYSLINNWEKPCYIVKQGCIKFNSLYSQEVLEQLIQEGKSYKPPENVVVDNKTEVKEKETPDQFARLYALYLQIKEDAPLTVKEIRAWIAFQYIKDCKCLPHPGNITRWSASIYFQIKSPNDWRSVYQEIAHHSEIENVNI